MKYVAASVKNRCFLQSTRYMIVMTLFIIQKNTFRLDKSFGVVYHYTVNSKATAPHSYIRTIWLVSVSFFSRRIL